MKEARTGRSPPTLMSARKPEVNRITGIISPTRGGRHVIHLSLPACLSISRSVRSLIRMPDSPLLKTA